MAHIEKARVFMSGRSQAVRIPAEYRFTANEVYIRKDDQTGDIILSQAPGSWTEIFAALDEAGFPDDFLAERNQGFPQEREEVVNRRYMLDTNMVSYIAGAKSKAARARLVSLDAGEVVCISAITEGELRVGLAKNPEAQKRSAALEWFLSRLQILPWSREEASSYGLLRAQQEAEGKALESMDMLIAAHAVAAGAILVTRDKVFTQISGLTLEDWATDLQG